MMSTNMPNPNLQYFQFYRFVFSVGVLLFSLFIPYKSTMLSLNKRSLKERRLNIEKSTFKSMCVPSHQSFRGSSFDFSSRIN